MPRSGPRTVRRSSEEFKLTAVRLSQQPGIQVQTMAAALAIHPFMRSKWRKDARDGVLRAARAATSPARRRRSTPLRLTHGVVHPDRIELARPTAVVQNQTRSTTRTRYKTAIGVLCASGSMESLSSSPHRTAVARVREGARLGAGIGAAFVGVGIVRMIAALLFGHRLEVQWARDVALLVFYVAGFALAGAVLGPLWPLRRTWPGALLVGYLGAGVVCAVCGVIVMEITSQPDWGFYPSLVGIMTLIFETVAAAIFHDE